MKVAEKGGRFKNGFDSRSQQLMELSLCVSSNQQESSFWQEK
jgi:hypothetical protein